MLKYLFDTDHLTLFDHGNALVTQRFAREPPGKVGVSIVTVEEYLRGRLAYVSRARDAAGRIQGYHWFLRSVQFFHVWSIVPFDQAADQEYQHLVGSYLRVGTQDLKIAAVALANKLILVTRYLSDFGQIPSLVIEDWSV